MGTASQSAALVSGSHVARDVAAKDTKALTVATALVEITITGAAGYIKVLG